MFVIGGELIDGGLGFFNFDNLEFDDKGNFWIVIDIIINK